MLIIPNSKKSINNKISLILDDNDEMISEAGWSKLSRITSIAENLGTDLYQIYVNKFY